MVQWLNSASTVLYIVVFYYEINVETRTGSWMANEMLKMPVTYLMHEAKKMIAKTTAPRCSHVVTNRSTKRALTSLTSKIERDSVLSGRYGRSCPIEAQK